jgi:hypothetical protein
MKQSEFFALMEWLTEFPDNLTYDDIYRMLTKGDEQWVHPDIDVWEVVEHHTLDQVAEYIETTRSHFERVTEPLVSALRDAIKLAQENAPDMIDDENFTDRLNRLQGVLADWSDA